MSYPNTLSKPLRLDFYLSPERALPILASLLRTDSKVATYIQAFTSVELPSLAELAGLSLQNGDLVRVLRKVQLYWAILKRAGFRANESKLLEQMPSFGPAGGFNPGFSSELREAMYQAATDCRQEGERRPCVPPAPENLSELVREWEVLSAFRRSDPGNRLLQSRSSGRPLLDADDKAMLDFFDPPGGRSGPSLLQPYRKYHSPKAGDFISEILTHLDHGKTVILDLGNANSEVVSYFSDKLSQEVLNHQDQKFNTNTLAGQYLLYFEEAHNLFPRGGPDNSVYTKLAKEGDKYHIGLVYATQSPPSLSPELLKQTENFAVGHLSSREEVEALSRVNTSFDAVLGEDILQSKSPGYLRVLTHSHRFVIGVQVRKFVTEEGA